MTLSHHLTRMSGRDPSEEHRASTPLELLFDLTFVVAFSAASSQTAELLEVGHFAAAWTGFGIAVFATIWAWVNFTWLASAYDNDDVFFRIATLVEMTGVIVIALGIPQLFHSIDEGAHIDNRVMVAGYVVMRVAAVALWLRAARYDPARRRVCLTYAVAITIAQVGWVAVIIMSMPLTATLILIVILTIVEFAGPLLAERTDGGTPWHPHHIAERYSLLVIITIGEVILGTVLAVSATVDELGWSTEAVLVAASGIGLAFGLWWIYFSLPSARVLVRHRERAITWAFTHIIVFGALVATGAGLHVAAASISGEHHISTMTAVALVAVPVLVFELTLVAIYSMLVRNVGAYHPWVFTTAALLLVGSVLAVLAGASVGVALLLVALSPTVIIVAYERGGYRREEEALEHAGL